LNKDGCSEELIAQYLENLIDKKISRSYWNQAMYSIRKYCEFFGHPFPKYIKKLRVPRKVKKIPLKNDILKAIKKTEYLKHKTVLLMLYDGFLRRSEIQKQKIEDIDFITNNVIIRNGKGGKDREVDISDVTKLFITYYLDTRNDKNPYLISKDGSNKRYLSKKTIYKIVKTAGKRIGQDNWHPHLLRHAGATHTFKKTQDLLRISRKLGHSDIMTTMHYLNLRREDLLLNSKIDYVPLIGNKSSVNRRRGSVNH
jgi:integrase